ncbi:hypothetical protein ASPSYDRAFT_63108 [Aspergillus sydowii CBS 593.65]|uniref:Zn(2)-C6 fungal-type domain-containing protein n=1 Tax=Aspergillus sydowii CBS 593.65 TaxID=1036612 RepID=A0A1L9SXN5_9EURO|nr:uncharacterized protein ASPSYDRAFT_63108 [Aspergillus sydowii CBS 593.65]OJJ51851.1 hypothetical protein ASPSYDRAFT_63108 [Aspergillus sydowii CBS 593.65]
MAEMMKADDKPVPYGQYNVSAPPEYPSLESTHGLPGAAEFDPPWRWSRTLYTGHHPDPPRASNASQPLLPSHNYPTMQNQELPQLPSNGPCGRPANLPAPAHAPSEAPPPHANFHPMNGAPPESSPLPAPPEFTRARMSFPPQDHAPHTNGDPLPPPQSLPPNEYATTAPPTVSHTPTPYHTSCYQAQSSNMRYSKPPRAQQACDKCRVRKTKCDEGRPACSHCKEHNLICAYTELLTRSPRQEKSTQLTLDRLQQLEDQLDTKLRDLERLHVGHDTTLDKISAMLTWDPGSEAQHPTQYPVMKADGSDAAQKPKTNEQMALATDGGKTLDPSVYTKGILQTAEDGGLSIPVEHTTAAHKLLGWPLIMSLLPRYDDDYVMKLERYRGLVRFEGRGEAQETDEEVPSQPTSFNTNLDENFSQYASPNGTWIQNTKYNEAPPEVRGIDEYGVMSIDGETVRRYRDSYLEHIHKLHPFLNQHDLEQRTESFIAMHCPKPFSQQLSAKRKRSGDELQGPNYEQQSSPIAQPHGAAPPKVQYSARNAIFLLVIALGRICEVRNEPIRGPCTDRIIDYRNESIPGETPRAGVSGLSPAGPDSMGPPTNEAPMPPVMDEKSITLPDPPHLQNVDTVPGLVYYAYAARILGFHQGATSLPYVQAALLACLYTGQLAHSFQSHSWIAQAANACQVLTLPKSNRELQDDHNKDLVNFAYWSCLQLESDILAELDLPASGISRSESRISLPTGRFTISLSNNISAPNTMMMFLYSAQIHLRKILNRVHTDLYKVEKQGETRWSPNVQEILSIDLDLWRNSLPQKMRWSDNEPPSPDINVARMRAKYYGARYIIHRPLLYHALHYCGPNTAISSEVSPSLTHGQYAPSMTCMSNDLGSVRGGNGTAHMYRDLPQKLRRACKVCLLSAVRSTEAFDAIKGRPVVTNIFGTAHAQFGNMLVLSTVYMSHLTDLVDRNELERLLRRTIAFLLQNRNISPTLRADAKILADIYEKIFDEPPTLTVMDG